MEGLKIEIGANIQAALTQMVKLTAAVDGLDKSTAGVGKNLAAIPAALRPINSNSIKQLGEAVNKLKTDLASQGGIKTLPASLNAIQPAAASAAAAVGRIKPGSDQAANALMNLGRVAQDAPFGFIGIANNLSPLFESFGRLGTAAGGLSGALKALGTSLMGVGGIGLALSAFQFIMLGGVDTVKKMFSATKELSDEEKKLAESLRSSQESLQKQLISVESLVRVATSDVSTKKQQADALAKLNDLIPDNVGVLTAQNIRMSEGVGIIRQYTKALEDQATAELFINKAAGIRATQFEDRQKAVKDLSALYIQQRELQARLATASTSNAGGISIGGSAAGAQESEAERIKARLVAIRVEIDKVTKGFTDSRGKLNQELTAIRKEIDKGVQGSVQLDTPDAKPAKIDKVKAKEDEDIIATRIKQLEELKNVAGLLKKEEFELLDLKINLAVRDQGKNGLNDGQLQRNISALIASSGIKADIPLNIIAKNPALAKANINTMLATQAFELETNVTIKPTIDRKFLRDMAGIMQTVESTVEGISVGLAETIGEVLGGGDFGNALKGFTTMLADGLIQIGKAAIGFGIGMQAIKEALSSLQPAVALAAGVALVALGATLKQAVQGQAKKFATGGIVTGPTNAIIGEGGQPEAIFPLRDLNKFIGNIRGNGNDPSGIVGQTYVEGEQIKIVLARVNNRWGNSFG